MTVRVLSLGAGVQSSTLLLMACEGELQIDAAIFADTGWEPAAVYEWLGLLEAKALGAGISVYRVSAGNIRSDTLRSDKRVESIPLFIRNNDGSVGMGRRECTQFYKIRPIRRQLRTFGATAKKPTDLLIGISLDEWQRMKDSPVQYARHIYPLVERRMTRGDCMAWLQRHGYQTPQKSACIGCPFRRNAEWRTLTTAEFADAVDYDQRVRTVRPGMRGEQFLHRSAIPLDMVDLSTEQDRGQTEMDFDGCGVLCANEGAA